MVLATVDLGTEVELTAAATPARVVAAAATGRESTMENAEFA